jgi:hypothetical protein
MMRNWFHIILLMFIPAMYCSAQNSWDLTIAFEDATGAKDTLRIYWDDDATYEDDVPFSEMPISPNLEGNFEVFFDDISAITGSSALQYTNIASPWVNEGFDGFIHAINYEEPVIMTYLGGSFTDTEIFPFLENNPIRGQMENDYFFAGPYSEFPCSCLEMANHDSIFLIDRTTSSWPYGPHFPILFSIFKGETINTSDIEPQSTPIFPNPARSVINFETGEENFTNYSIWDAQGRNVMNGTFESSKSSDRIEVQDLPAGTYILKLFDRNGESVQKRFVKSPR